MIAKRDQETRVDDDEAVRVRALLPHRDHVGRADAVCDGCVVEVTVNRYISRHSDFCAWLRDDKCDCWQPRKTILALLRSDLNFSDQVVGDSPEKLPDHNLTGSPILTKTDNNAEPQNPPRRGGKSTTSTESDSNL